MSLVKLAVVNLNQMAQLKSMTPEQGFHYNTLTQNAAKLKASGGMDLNARKAMQVASRNLKASGVQRAMPQVAEKAAPAIGGMVSKLKTFGGTLAKAI